MFRLTRRLLIKKTFPGKQFLFTDFPSRASYFSHSGNTQNYSFVIVDISYLVLMACAFGKMSDFRLLLQFFASQHDNYQYFYRFSRFINFHLLDGWMGWKNTRKVNEPLMILLINNNFFPFLKKLYRQIIFHPDYSTMKWWVHVA